ncbi:Uncharacterised protein [Candidatus Tiddalikarchaeum anstoanum]|nr:Uncharacterised protein [Candidatus Tiddalikarchaeum anstoanum]
MLKIINVFKLNKDTLIKIIIYVFTFLALYLDWTPLIKLISFALFLGYGIYTEFANAKENKPLFINLILYFLLLPIVFLYGWIVVFNFKLPESLLIPVVIGTLTITLLSCAIGLILCCVIIGKLGFDKLIKSKKNDDLVGMGFGYSIIAVAIILGGAGFFMLSPVLGPNNSLVYEKNQITISSLDYLYFSTSVFVSNALGEIQPQGVSKVIMLIESFLTSLLNIIVVGEIICGYLDKKAKQDQTTKLGEEMLRLLEKDYLIIKTKRKKY